MRNERLAKLFLVLVFCTGYFFIFSHFGAKAYESLTSNKDNFKEGTTVGTVSISGLNKVDAKKKLDTEVANWLSNTIIQVAYLEDQITLDNALFHFDIDATLEQIKQGENNELQAYIDPVGDAIMNLSPSLSLKDFNMEELQNQLLSSAKSLQSGNIEVNLDDFYITAGNTEPVLLQEVKLDFNEVPKELLLFLNEPIEFLPNTQFSFLNYLKEKKVKGISPDSLSVIASGIYQTILSTNFSIIERNISDRPPEYTMLGTEAYVDPNLNNDLVFANLDQSSYFITIERSGTSLVFKLDGPKLVNSYSVEMKNKQTFKPKIIPQFNAQLKLGQVKVIEEGKEGFLIEVYRISIDAKGEHVKEELISEDFYPPVHRVELHPLAINLDQIPEGNTSEENGEDSENEEENEVVDPNDESIPDEVPSEELPIEEDTDNQSS